MVMAVAMAAAMAAAAMAGVMAMARWTSGDCGQRLSAHTTGQCLPHHACKHIQHAQLRPSSKEAGLDGKVVGATAEGADSRVCKAGAQRARAKVAASGSAHHRLDSVRCGSGCGCRDSRAGGGKGGWLLRNGRNRGTLDPSKAFVVEDGSACDAAAAAGGGGGGGGHRLPGMAASALTRPSGPEHHCSGTVYSI